MKIVVYLLGILAVLLGYQNCAGHGFQSSSTEPANVPTNFSTLQTDANIVWSLNGGTPDLILSAAGDVDSWTDATKVGITLASPTTTSSGTAQFDPIKSPILNSTSHANSLTFSLGRFMQATVPGTAAGIDEYSVAMFVSNIQLAAAPATTRIFEFFPTDGSTPGSLGIDMLDLQNGNAQVTAFQQVNGATVASVVTQVPTTHLTAGFGITARFTLGASNLLVSINGTPSTTLGTPATIPACPPGFTIYGGLYGTTCGGTQTCWAPTSSGAVGGVGAGPYGYPNSFVQCTSNQKQLVTGPPELRIFRLHGAGQNGSFDISEFAIWTRALTDAQLNSYSQQLFQSYSKN